MNHLAVVGSVPAEGAGLTCLDAFQQELDNIFRTMRRLGVAPAELEDLAQEMFLALQSAWPKYDTTRPLRPYVYGILFKVASVHRRKARGDLLRPVGDLPDLPDPALTVEDALHAREIHNLALAALQMIELPHRAVLIMRDFDDIPIADVARELSIPLFTAYARLRKARSQFTVALRRLLRQSRRPSRRI